MTADVNEQEVIDDKETEQVNQVDDIEAFKQSIMDSIKEQFESEISKLKDDFQKEITKKDNELNDLRAINSALAMNTSGNSKQNDSVLADDFEDIDFDKVAKGILDNIDSKLYKI